MKDKQFWNFSILMYDFWHMLEHNSYKLVAENISSDLKGNERVLEVACGTGILTDEITKRQKQLDYTAIDYAPNMIDICHKKRIDANFILSDATNLPFEDTSFDTIIIANALHIMPEPIRVLDEIKRCLKNNGTIYAPNFLTPTTLGEKFVLDIIRKFGYNVYNEFTVESFTKFLVSNGLVVNRSEIYHCIRTLLFTVCSKQQEDLLVKERVKK